MRTLHKKALFWDIDVLDSRKDADFIIGRILNFGDIDDFKWAIRHYGSRKIKENFLKSRSLGRKSFSFWRRYFNIDEPLCLQKQLTMKQGAFWKRLPEAE